ncbi:MAG: hypothetical protein Q7U66_09155 [Methylobacter sp.]|nr:hypothetical protein [Methylobacter sp.]
MLFPYKYVSHPIEKMQEYVDFIFNDVWCKAPNSEYGIELFEENSDLKGIVEYLWGYDLAGKPKKSAVFFLNGLNKIFNEFKGLNPSDIAQFKAWYASNNDIEKCCCNDAAIAPIRYDQLTVKFEKLTEELEEFFKNLYSHNFLALETIKNHIGTVSDHYSKFVQKNDEDICPFCGIMPLDGQYDPTRDAYDHYLPKSKYPFNSINFKNLPPACNTCNSKNKGAKDPININGAARKAFYPFTHTPYKLEFKVFFNPKNWNDYTPSEIMMSVGPTAYVNEISTWFDVYGIEDRYKALMCKKNVGKFWITQVQSWVCRGGKAEEYFLELAEIESNSPYADYNFLKKPFLEACYQSGLFMVNGT